MAFSALMSRCIECGATLVKGQRYCGGCGVPSLPESEQPTTTGFNGAADVRRSHRPGSAPSRTTSDHGRFVPGTVLDDRYRILGLLGRGGMGEVYRADDLKLGQQVALKFLPEDFEQDPERLQRFLNEVKIARQITHPNVCRVYDVGEADGRHFLSMEYVDGEDLASLLRRIGRLPQDKAVQIGRQLCAGLAAAHDQGILHRDLKPANVMLDGRGRVRITDFGLSGLAEAFEGLELRAGTPAYMAPEQLAGREVSVRSDLYALGLVLYEIFTGRRAFAADSAAELVQRQESAPTTPSSLIEGLDPAVERIILRCLEVYPLHRPASALEVAAGLPGGDPLAAALAAGETPSPEMVANAVEPGALRPVVAVALLATALVLVIAAVLIRPVAFLHEQVPFEKPPQELLASAKTVLADLGYEDIPRYSYFGFRPNQELIEHIESSHPSPEAWTELADGTPPGILFWARFSPESLEPTDFHESYVTLTDPRYSPRGSVTVELDTLGHLVSLEITAPEFRGEMDGPPEPDWARVFELAGLAKADFVPAESVSIFRVHTDRVLAWRGPYPWFADEGEAVVEAGSLNGRLNFFQILGPHNTPDEMADSGESSSGLFMVANSLMILSVMVGAVLLARRNLAMGRGDRKGAARVAVLVFVLVVLTWLILGVKLRETSLDHLTSSLVFGRVLGHGLVHATLFWLFYVALEPYVRRIWPQTLVSWTRLLRGRLRDPMVGRDILVGGVAAGLIAGVLPWIDRWIELKVIGQSSAPIVGHLSWSLSLVPMDWVGSMILNIYNQLFVSALVLTFLVLLGILLRRRWLAVVAFFVIYLAIDLLGRISSPPNSMAAVALGMSISLAIGIIMVITLLRFGLLAGMVSSCMLPILGGFLFTFDLSRWYASGSLIVLAVVLGTLAYGFVISLGGQRLFSDPFET